MLRRALARAVPDRTSRTCSYGPAGPSAKHWFGTDELGRDQLTEILYAGQISLKIGLAVAFLSTVVGVIVGAVAGYFGKAGSTRA